MAALTDYVSRHTTGGFTNDAADIFALRRIVLRGIKELKLNVRKSDINHVTERTITLCVIPTPTDIKEHQYRGTTHAVRQRNLAGV